jgi:acyl-CoA thioester hydrolase
MGAEPLVATQLGAPSPTSASAARTGSDNSSGVEGPARSGFVWGTRVFFDELDAMGMLHNARYLVLIERVSSAFFEANGWQWEPEVALNPDQHYVVREQSVRYLEPVLGPSDLVVEMWVDALGQTSVSLGFEIRSADGAPVHARAQRVHVKLDPVSLRPTPWTQALRAQLATLLSVQS